MTKRLYYVVFVCLITLLGSVPIMAQDKGVDELIPHTTYYRLNGGTDHNTFGDPATDAGWTEYTGSLQINAGQSYWFGATNTYVDVWAKTYYLKLDGTSISSLNITQAYGVYYPDGTTRTYSSTGTLQKDCAGTGCTFWTSFAPQPQFEYILIQNGGASPVTITIAETWTDCKPVPALTTIGLIGLALVLAVTTVIIVRRKRAAIA